LKLDREALISSLVTAFAKHRIQPGKALDHFLPPEVHDPELWDADGIYLYIISEGSIGGPLPPGRRVPKKHPPDGEPPLQASCDACFDDPMSAPRRALVERLAGDAADVGGGLLQLIEAEVGPGFEGLREKLYGEVLSNLAGLNRVKLLDTLKQLGLTLPERQKLANIIAKAKREGRYGLGEVVAVPPRPERAPIPGAAVCATAEGTATSVLDFLAAAERRRRDAMITTSGGPPQPPSLPSTQ